MKVSELQGAALDWAVALIEYPEWKEQGFLEVFPYDLQFDDGEVYSPSTDWAQGGPIIEREGIEMFRNKEKNYWFTGHFLGSVGTGTTPLIAAMRCYVASKLGEEVEIPFEKEGITE